MPNFWNLYSLFPQDSFLDLLSRYDGVLQIRRVSDFNLTDVDETQAELVVLNSVQKKYMTIHFRKPKSVRRIPLKVIFKYPLP